LINKIKLLKFNNNNNISNKTKSNKNKSNNKIYYNKISNSDNTSIKKEKKLYKKIY